MQMRKPPSSAAVYGRTHANGFLPIKEDARSTQARRSPSLVWDANANLRLGPPQDANAKIAADANRKLPTRNWQRTQMQKCKWVFENPKCKLKNECRSPTHREILHGIDNKFTISRDCQGLPVNVWQKRWYCEKNINLGKPGEDRDHAAGIAFPVIVGGCRCRFSYDRRRLLFSFGPSAADTDFYFFPVSISTNNAAQSRPRTTPGTWAAFIYRCRENFFRLFRKKYLKCCLTSAILYMMLNNIKRTLTI